jgi:hypothetical protein
MHIIIGLAAAVALLYFWLSGHWFARVLAFLLFATVIGFIGATLGGQIDTMAPPQAAAVVDCSSVGNPYDRKLCEGDASVAARTMTGAEIDQAFIDADKAARISAAVAKPASPIFAWLGCIVGIAGAWPVASIPIYVTRRSQHTMTTPGNQHGG